MSTNIIENLDKDCGVDEEMFPCMGKCCNKNDTSFINSYEIICPYCDITSSFLYGASIKTVIIYECRKFDYGKRVTEQ